MKTDQFIEVSIKHDCHDCKRYMRCNMVDRKRNERCADYEEKKNAKNRI